MKFALIGDDPAAQPWLKALAAGGHSLCAAALADRLFDGGAGSSVRRVTWEHLLTDRDLDAVLIAGDTDEVLAAAKQLATDSRPLLILPSLALGIATAYELSLIRDDSRVVLMPAFAHRGDAELQSLSQRLRSGEIGAVRRLQIDVERSLTRSMSESDIEAAALPDVDLLRWLGGNYDQVTSQRSGQTEQGCSQATLTLAGSGLPDATWSARYGTQRSWRLTIETERETITVVRDAVEPNAECLASVVAQFNAACCGQPITTDWSDAVRVFDVLDAARRSLRRRRTIDLHFETLSERQQFKTQMTAIGCGLLLLTLVLMFGLLGLGAVFDARDRSVRDARAAGLVALLDDFPAGASEFPPTSVARLDQMAERLQSAATSAFVEPAVNPPDAELDQRRRVELVKQLAGRGVIAADHRTRIAPAQSHGWEIMLRVLRIAWIVPLVLFLGLQLLLFVAKPATERDRSEPAEANR